MTAEEHQNLWVSIRDHFESRLRGVEKAITLATNSLDKRLENMNEFRSQLKDQAENFITRREHEILIMQIQELKEFRAELKGTAKQSSVVVAYGISAISLILAMASFLHAFIK